MKIDIFNNLIKPHKHLKPNDLSPEEKKNLYALMMKHGASYSFGYDRFFKEGFSEWELIGINAIKKDFLKLHDAEIANAVPDDGNNEDRGYAAVLELEADNKGGFWNILGQVRSLKSSFREYMSNLGMLSSITVFNRFSKDNWKDWELIGIYAIIEEYKKNAEKV